MEECFYTIFKWIYDNAGVIFSGIGVLAISTIIGWYNSRKKKALDAQKDEENAQRAKEALELEATKLRLQVMPELWINTTYLNKMDKRIKIDLNNNGDTAKLMSAIVLTDNLRQESIPFPYSLNKGDILYLHFTYTGKGHMDNDKFAIELVFKDKLNNTYKSLILGESHFKIESTKLIND